MRRIHDMGEDATLDNIQGAWDSFSDGKTHRRNIRSYERNLQRNLERVLDELKKETWQPSPYIEKNVFERKPRKLAKAPIDDHVLEAAAVRPYEKSLYDYIAWQVPAVRPNMGQKALLRSLRNELFAHSQEDCMYYLSMDAHHYFPLMDHAILKRQISRKVKPGRLHRILYKVVDSYNNGAPLELRCLRYMVNCILQTSTGSPCGSSTSERIMISSPYGHASTSRLESSMRPRRKTTRTFAGGQPFLQKNSRNTSLRVFHYILDSLITSSSDTLIRQSSA